MSTFVPSIPRIYRPRLLLAPQLTVHKLYPLSSSRPIIRVCVALVPFQAGLQTSNHHVFGLKSWQTRPFKTSSYSWLNSNPQAGASSRRRNKFVISNPQHGALSPVSRELQAALSTASSGPCGTAARLDSTRLGFGPCEFAPHSTLPLPSSSRHLIFYVASVFATGGGYRVVHEQGCSLTM